MLDRYSGAGVGRTFRNSRDSGLCRLFGKLWDGPMELIVRIITVAVFVVACWLWFSGRKAVESTSLVSAWRWGAGAAVVGTLAAVMSLSRWYAWGPDTRGVEDHLWYASCLLWLCPLVAVLGARRPGAAAWDVFVILPLLLVLEWPVTGVTLAAWFGGVIHELTLEEITLEWPTLVGLCVVLVMGGGNYLGTRFFPAVTGFVLSLVLLTWPLFPWASGSSNGAAWTRLAGALLLIGSGGLAHWQVRSMSRPNREQHPLDGAWRDFRDMFGVAWARRVQLRVNEDLRRCSGGGVLGFDGVEFPAVNEQLDVNESQRQESYQRAELTLRRLWKRFVDPAWVVLRLGESEAEAPLGAAE